MRLEGVKNQAAAEEERDEVIETIAILGRMDRELMDPYLRRFLVAVSAVSFSSSVDWKRIATDDFFLFQIPSPHRPSVDFLVSLQDYHRQTRTLPTLVALLYSVVPTAAAGADETAYRRISHGPLFDSSFLAHLGKGLSGFLGVQGQIAESLEELKEVFNLAISDVQKSLAGSSVPTTGDDDGERKKKKRKTKSTSSGPATSAAATLSLLSRIARVYLSSASNLLTTNLPSTLLSSLTALYQQVLDDVAKPLVALGIESSSTWAGEMVLVSGLRLWTASQPVLGSEYNRFDETVVAQLGRMSAEKATGGEAAYEVVNSSFLSVKA